MPRPSESGPARPAGDGALRFRFTRGQLRSEVAEWLHATADTAAGKPAYRLSALGELDREHFSTLVPRIAPECRISVRDGVVLAHRPGGGEPVRVVTAAGPELLVFNSIDGHTSVAGITERLAADIGGDVDEAYARCRSMVLRLIGARVCIPAGRS